MSISSKGSKKTKSRYNNPPGPVANRRCRDILFLIIFLAFWGGMFYLASVVAKSGDPKKVV